MPRTTEASLQTKKLRPGYKPSAWLSNYNSRINPMVGEYQRSAKKMSGERHHNASQVNNQLNKESTYCTDVVTPRKRFIASHPETAGNVIKY
jgi:hypothetical protein